MQSRDRQARKRTGKQFSGTPIDMRSMSLDVECLEARRVLAVVGAAREPAAEWVAEDYWQPVTQPFSRASVSSDAIVERAQQLPFVRNELIVAVQATAGKEPAYLARWAQLLPFGDLRNTNTILKVPSTPDGPVEIWSLEWTGNVDSVSAMRHVEQDPNVLWASPNFIYDGPDPRDLIPNDPHYPLQLHHPLMQMPAAWDLTTGDASIVIAVTDDGIDQNHPDFANALWVNAGEIPGNGIDDDGNGYIDDVHGWNFAGNNNDVRHGPLDYHGTHVSGIVGARTNNGVGVAGTAGGARIMPLRFFDVSDTFKFTSAAIAETFVYAADQGAHIVNTSYSIDYFVGDPIFTAGLQYLYDQGVLHFTSAGNDNWPNPSRQSFEQSIMVASTTMADKKSSFSNYGTGMDLSAPGDMIFSTLRNGFYGYFSGTSMSAPNAAGIAALVWSMHPTWNRDQVAAQLIGTADSIDADNPAHSGMLGAGRVNGHRALTESLLAPRLKGVLGLPASGQQTSATSITYFSLAFNQVMAPASVNDLDVYELREAGADRTFDTADDVVLSLSAPKPYQVATNQFQLEIADGPLDYGYYRLTVRSADLHNPFDTEFDGDGDGIAGGDFVSEFRVAPPFFTPVAPFGGLIYHTQFASQIATAAEVDAFSFSFLAGNMVSTLVQGEVGLVPEVKIIDADGNTLATAVSDQQGALIQHFVVPIDGEYDVVISGSAATFGDYTVDILINAAVETEAVSVIANDDAASAENIDGSAIEIGMGAAARMAVVGSFSAATVDHEDWYQFTLADGEKISLYVHSTKDDSNISLELFDSDGITRLAIGVANHSIHERIVGFVDPTSDLQPATYYVRVRGDDEVYALVATRGAYLEREDPGSHTAITGPEPFLGYLRPSLQVEIDPDDFANETVFVDQFPDARLSDAHGGVVRALAIPGAPTGGHVFAPFSGTSWSAGRNELRVDFTRPVEYVSIDVGANDPTDIGMVRAYNAQDELIAWMNSRVAKPGQPQTVLINRHEGDIAYIVASGIGNDSVQLDNLRFGVSNGMDKYRMPVNVGDTLVVDVAMLIADPNRWGRPTSPLEADLQLELYDPNGALVVAGTATINHVAAISGDYELQVHSPQSAESYLLTFDGVAPDGSTFHVHASKPADGALLNAHPQAFVVTFSAWLDLTSVDASDLIVNGLPALSVHHVDGQTLSFELDPASDSGGGISDVEIAAGALRDLQGRELDAFAAQFDRTELAPFVPWGPAGSAVYVSGPTTVPLDAALQRQFRFLLDPNEHVAVFVEPQDPLVTLSIELVGISNVVVAPGPGMPVLIPTSAASANGVVELIVRGDVAAEFTLFVYRNTQIDDLANPLSAVLLTPILSGIGPSRFAAVGYLNGDGLTTGDEYELELSSVSGMPLDFVLTGTSAPFTGTLELLDSSNNVVQTAISVPGSNVDAMILAFQPTLGETYRLRIGGTWVGEYVLAGVAGAVFELEPNLPANELRQLDGVPSVVGSLDDGQDNFTIWMSKGQTILLEVTTVLASHSLGLNNTLSPRIAIYDANDVLLATHGGISDAQLIFTADTAGAYRIALQSDFGSGNYWLQIATSGRVDADFDNDGLVGCGDINALMAALIAGGYNASFDLDDDGALNAGDLNRWLVDASIFLGYGRPILPGDANLDGVVDGSDFNSWNAHRFTTNSNWCDGNFTLDAVIDGSDFGVWNAHKFRSSITTTATISSASAVEGDYLIFEVTLSRPLVVYSTMNLVAAGITAVGGVDFDHHGFEYSTDGGVHWQPTAGNSGSEIAFPPGVVLVHVRVQAYEDQELELDETFSLTGRPFIGNIVGTSMAIGTIIDNDAVSNVVISDTSAPEGEFLVFTVSLGNPSNDDITLELVATELTATAGVDYEADHFEYSSDNGENWHPATNGNVVTFVAGATEILVRVPSIQDLIDEPDEQFLVNVSAWTGPVGTITAGTGTILDDDDAPVISIDNASALEGDPLVFSIMLSNPSSEAITLALIITDITATADIDYETDTLEYSIDNGDTWLAVIDDEITFAVGETQILVRVQSVDDTDFEGDETFSLGATVVSGTAVEPADATGTIVDDDLLTVTIADASATEGEFLVFAVTLNGAASESITLELATTEGTATADIDYETDTLEYSIDNGDTWLAVVDDEVTFAVGETQILVRVQSVDDTDFEGDETFSLGATVVSGTAVEPADATGTIVDDDLLTVTIGDASATEGEFVVFAVTLNGAAAEAITLELATTEGTATADVDYETETLEYSIDNGDTWLAVVEDEITFAVGETQILVRVQSVDDTDFEGDETFFLGATVVSGTAVEPADATGTIVDDDLLTVTIGDASATEGEFVVFAVTLNGAAAEAITLELATTEGSATADIDYETGTLEYSIDNGDTWLAVVNDEITFAVGETQILVRVQSVDDTDFEGDETFSLGATVVSGTAVEPADATGTIVDDDLLTVMIGDASATEGEFLVFAVTLNGAASESITLELATTEGTATADIDYETGTLEYSIDNGDTWLAVIDDEITFAVGETQILIRVQSVDDTDFEGDETFFLGATVVSGTAVEPADATGTIVDDDLLTVTIADASATEGEFVVFAVTLNGAASESITLELATTEGTATADVDYETETLEYSIDNGDTWLAVIDDEITFAVGETQILVRVQSVDDTDFEGDETFFLGATVVSGTAVEPADATGTIVDDDLLTVTIADASATEGEFVVFAVSLNGAAAEAITLELATTEGTATADIDYETDTLEYSIDNGDTWSAVVEDEVTFAVGETQILVRVQSVDDMDFESDETFFLGATVVSGTAVEPDNATGTIIDDDTVLRSPNEGLPWIPALRGAADRESANRESAWSSRADAAFMGWKRHDATTLSASKGRISRWLAL